MRPEVTDRGCATSPSCSGTLRASRRVGTRVAHLRAVISGPRLSFPLCVSAWGVHAGPCSPTFSWAVSGLGSLAEAFSSLPVPGLEPFLPSFLRVSSSADTGHLCLLVSTCPLKPLAAAHTRVRLCVCLGAALFSICSCSFQSFDPFVLVPDSGGPCVLHSRPCVLRSLVILSGVCLAAGPQSRCRSLLGRWLGVGHPVNWPPVGLVSCGSVSDASFPGTSWSSEPPAPCGPAGGERRSLCWRRPGGDSRGNCPPQGECPQGAVPSPLLSGQFALGSARPPRCGGDLGGAGTLSTALSWPRPRLP